MDISRFIQREILQSCQNAHKLDCTLLGFISHFDEATIENAAIYNNIYIIQHTERITLRCRNIAIKHSDISIIHYIFIKNRFPASEYGSNLLQTHIWLLSHSKLSSIRGEHYHDDLSLTQLTNFSCGERRESELYSIGWSMMSSNKVPLMQFAKNVLRVIAKNEMIDTEGMTGIEVLHWMLTNVRTCVSDYDPDSVDAIYLCAHNLCESPCKFCE
jgi:hypothetical protein